MRMGSLMTAVFSLLFLVSGNIRFIRLFTGSEVSNKEYHALLYVAHVTVTSILSGGATV